MKRVELISDNGRVIARDCDGNRFEISGIVIPKPDGKPDAFYDSSTSFYKAACPSGTTHGAEMIW